MAYMPMAPVISVSQALGTKPLLNMLMIVQGTTPKNSSMAVQHCTAVAASSCSAIHASTTTPNLAILSRAAAGTPLVHT